MAFENAKSLLDEADTSEKRSAAIRNALRQGMSLSDIEAYLDLLDHVRAQDEADRRKSERGDQPATDR
jgi:DNA-binding transcriptional MerR regulator